MAIIINLYLPILSANPQSALKCLDCTWIYKAEFVVGIYSDKCTYPNHFLTGLRTLIEN